MTDEWKGEMLEERNHKAGALFGIPVNKWFALEGSDGVDILIHSRMAVPGRSVAVMPIELRKWGASVSTELRDFELMNDPSPADALIAIIEAGIRNLDQMLETRAEELAAKGEFWDELPDTVDEHGRIHKATKPDDPKFLAEKKIEQLRKKLALPPLQKRMEHLFPDPPSEEEEE
jgi:hypothetical protein